MGTDECDGFSDSDSKWKVDFSISLPADEDVDWKDILQAIAETLGVERHQVFLKRLVRKLLSELGRRAVSEVVEAEVEVVTDNEGGAEELSDAVDNLPNNGALDDAIAAVTGGSGALVSAPSVSEPSTGDSDGSSGSD